MMPTKVTACLVAALLALTSATSKAEESRNIHMGGIFSPKGCGVVLHGTGENSSFMITLRSDFQDLIDGKSEVPGVVGSFAVHYPAKEWKTRLGKVKWLIGPAVSVGYVRDSERSHGFMSSIGCSTGACFSFNGSPFVISACLTGEIGVHALRGRDLHDIKLQLYSNGLKRAWMPELTISYGF